MSRILVVRDPLAIRRMLEHLGERADLGVPQRAWHRLPIDDAAPSRFDAVDAIPPDEWNGASEQGASENIRPRAAGGRAGASCRVISSYTICDPMGQRPPAASRSRR